MLKQILAAVAVAALGASNALAHVSLETKEAAVGSTYKAVLRIPHGCEGKPTNVVRVKIPEGVIAVKPMPKAGWTLEKVKGAYAKSYDLHGTRPAKESRRLSGRAAAWLTTSTTNSRCGHSSQLTLLLASSSTSPSSKNALRAPPNAGSRCLRQDRKPMTSSGRLPP